MTAIAPSDVAPPEIAPSEIAAARPVLPTSVPDSAPPPGDQRLAAVETSVTELLEAQADGIDGATDRLMQKVYDDLRRLARYRLRGRPPQTLDSRALVHETYLKLLANRPGRWRDGGHFRAAFGQAMRHVLVDAARHRMSSKRGGGQREATWTEALGAEPRVEPTDAELLAVGEALDLLHRLDERLARVVECRFFFGMTEGETAHCLGVSSRTVHRDWLRARGWLRVRLGGVLPGVEGTPR